jgi:hypothetical protein
MKRSSRKIATFAFSGLWYYQLEEYRKRQMFSLAVAVRLAKLKYGADSPEYEAINRKAATYDKLMSLLPFAGSAGAFLLGPRLLPKLMA